MTYSQALRQPVAKPVMQPVLLLPHFNRLHTVSPPRLQSVQTASYHTDHRPTPRKPDLWQTPNRRSFVFTAAKPDMFTENAHAGSSDSEDFEQALRVLGSARGPLQLRNMFPGIADLRRCDVSQVPHQSGGFLQLEMPIQG
ncbi:hypothetical protein HPB50_029622 [Hyalomma asiaticum]|nr:hypothetical protein HPB50_029622 [Hyalomma asiaticum]